MQPNQGKKQYIKFRGEHFDFPKNYVGRLRRLNGRITTLKKSNNIIEETENVSVIEEPQVKEVTAVKKSNNRFKTKILAAILAISLVAGTSASLNKKNTGQEVFIDTTPSITASYTASETDSPVVITDVEETVSKAEELVSSEEKSSSLGTTSIGDFVNINEGSMIYTDSFNASSNTNGLARYFKDSKPRTVSSVVYTLNGNLYTVSNTADEASIQAAGGVISAVLISNENGNEGYININDVESIDYTAEMTR